MEGIKQYVAMEFTKIFIKCIKSYAQKYKTTYDNIFILLVLDETKNFGVGYRVIVKKKGDAGDTIEILETIGILDVLGVKRIHFKMYDQLAPPYIRDALKNLAQTNDIAEKEVSVLICTDDSDVFLFLYKWDIEKNQIVGATIKQLDDITDLF